METNNIKEIACRLEEIGNAKIKLAETILNQVLSPEERDALYFSAIKDNLDLVFSHCPNINPLLLANALQLTEMFGADHIYFTSKDKQLNRLPTQEEIINHYVETRAERFRKQFNTLMAKRPN